MPSLEFGVFFELFRPHQVYEFTRQSGNLAGQKFRKILHVPSCTVYKSFAKAEVDGFDRAKVQWPLDVD